MGGYRLTWTFPSGEVARMPEVSLVAESLDAAKTLAERTVGRFGGPFRGVREVILSDLSDPSVECSRWMRGRGWTDSQRQGS